MLGIVGEGGGRVGVGYEVLGIMLSNIGVIFRALCDVVS